MEEIEKLQEDFLKLGQCDGCGSQRCDGTLDWLEGCPHWRKFLKDNVSKNEV